MQHTEKTISHITTLPHVTTAGEHIVKDNLQSQFFNRYLIDPFENNYVTNVKLLHSKQFNSTSKSELSYVLKLKMS